MFKVAKMIYFNYGHRLLGGHDKPHSLSKDSKVNWASAGNLHLNEDRCQHKCSHLHGHSARVEIEMSAARLNRQGMVVDFFNIKETIGEWIDCHLDHKMILWSKDPLAKLLKNAGEPVVLVEENPTAEMLAGWIFCQARAMKLPVSKVTLWENQDSCACFEGKSKQ